MRSPIPSTEDDSPTIPAVSVAIRAYRERWLREAIESVLSQTHADLELVVLDDRGGLDAVVAEYADPRIRYHRTVAKLGASGRFAAAVELTRAPYVALLDDDDRYEPGFVAALAQELERRPGAGVAFSQAAYEVGGRLIEHRDDRAPGVRPEVAEEVLSHRTFIPPSVALFRRTAWDDAVRGMSLPDDVAPDTILHVGAAAAGWDHVLVDEPLVVRRWHAEQISRSGLPMARMTVRTWTALAGAHSELEPVRARTLARKRIRLAVHLLAASEAPAARDELAAARREAPYVWVVPRTLARLASAVPSVGRPLARAAASTVELREERLGPPPVFRSAGLRRRGAALLMRLRLIAETRVLQRLRRLTVDRRLSVQELWVAGKRDEVEFWRRWIGETTAERMRRRTDPFAELDEPLVAARIGGVGRETVRILDVGAGPLTRLGKVHQERKLEITAVDPLAPEYARLLAAAGIEAPVETSCCAAEEVLERFGEGAFDIVYARNAIDHAVQPLEAIRQMVAVTAPGGFVALRHRRNEGVAMGWIQLHQWNFDERDGELILWGRGGEHNVSRELGGAAEATCWTEQVPGGRPWILAVLERREP